LKAGSEIDLTRGGVVLHPYRVGDRVAFIADRQPFWVVVERERQVVRDDAPPMLVVGTGWGRFGQSYGVHPYVVLVLAPAVPSAAVVPEAKLVPVYHPYAPSMLDADPLQRLDRRFPTSLVARCR